MGRFILGILVVSAAAATMIGCSNKLETGYEPRRLGSTRVERRGYYAAPYTAEARAANEARPESGPAQQPQLGGY